MPRKNSCALPTPDATLEEVKAWVESIDINADDIISKEELEKGLRGLRMWFTRCRTKGAVNHVDHNRNGLIDTDEEFNDLVNYARKHWGDTIIVS